MNDRPVHLIVSDDLERSRVSVFFRLILAIPHLIWLGLWGIAAALAVIANWFATLFAGQSPESLHNFLAAYVRYAIHVGAYLLLAAQPFPDIHGRRPAIPVDVEIAPPQPQNRWKVAFRIVLAIPAFMIAGALTSGSARTYGVPTTATAWPVSPPCSAGSRRWPKPACPEACAMLSPTGSPTRPSSTPTCSS